MSNDDIKALCPYCKMNTNQIKAGLNSSGTQRYKCKYCSKRYTFQPLKRVYTEEYKNFAIKEFNRPGNQISISGMARVMRVSKGTFSNWIKTEKC